MQADGILGLSNLLSVDNFLDLAFKKNQISVRYYFGRSSKLIFISRAYLPSKSNLRTKVLIFTLDSFQNDYCKTPDMWMQRKAIIG